MPKTSPTVLLATLLVLAGSSALLWPAASQGGGAPAGETPTAQSSCAPCATVVDGSPGHDHFENMLAVSPLDPMTLVSAAMYRDNGTTMQVGLFVSRDAGLTWTRTPLPYGEEVPATHPLRIVNGVVDPAVTVSSDGSVLFSGVGFTNLGASTTQLPGQAVLFVARSIDGGETFAPEDVTILQQSFVPFHEFADMPRFASGPDGLVLLGWGSLDLPAVSALPRFLATLDVGKAASVQGRYSVSRDNGATWSTPALAFQDDELLYYPAHPAILPDGDWIFMPTGDYQNIRGGPVQIVRSSDEGASWSMTDTGIFGLIQGTLATSQVDGRIFYSYLIPTTDLNWATPAVAVAPGPDGPWTRIPLTSAPVRRMAIEDTIAVDDAGIAHVIYIVQESGEETGEIRIASIAPDHSFTSTLMDTIEVDHLATHYFGLDARPDGAAATWIAGTAPFALHGGVVGTG